MIINPLKVKSENIIYIYQKYFKMKKVIILMLLSISNIYGQDTIKPIFNGFGILKVNTTTISVIKELVTILNTQGRIINNSENESKARILIDNVENSDTDVKYGVVLMISEDTLNPSNSPIYSSSCKKAKIFIIGGYTVAGIKIKGLRLTFINDTLAEIHCKATTELTDAIRLKYGIGELKSKSKEVSCLYKYTGNSIKYEEKDITESWDNGDIRAYSQSSKYYNDKCEEKYLLYVNISSKKRTEEKRECEEETNLFRKQKNELEKKKLLNDF